LDHRQTLPVIAEQQTANLKGNFETGMDLWNRAMGMSFTIKYNKNPEIPVQNFTNQTLLKEERSVFREKAVSHHKTLFEHPNPPIGPLTDQPKGSFSPQNTV
jgi:hypothetical protein